MITLTDLRLRYSCKQEPLRSERRLELALIILGLLVVLQLVWLGIGSLRDANVRPIAPARDSLKVVDAAGVGSITATESLALQSRPVFWESRRPLERPEVRPEVQTAGSDAPARRLEKLQLTGVIGAGEQGTAIVSFKGKLMRLSVGDELEGWTLLSISPGAAVFSSGAARDERRLLPLPVIETAAAPGAQAESPVSAQAAGSAPAQAAQDNTPQRKAGNNQPAARTLSTGGR